MKKIRLKIAGLSYSQTRHGAYALILEEKKGGRRLPVIIGTSEAQSIAMQLEGLKPFRPLTHDLLVSMVNSFKIEVLEVNIIRLEEGIFYSELICKKDNTKIKIDARTSDAIAIALRLKAPIFVIESIMEKASINISSDEIIREEEVESKEKTYKDYSDKELKDMMKEAIDNEDYETASKIRDEIKNRKIK